MDKTVITRAMDYALLREGGFATVAWRYLDDPFPVWRDSMAAE